MKKVITWIVKAILSDPDLTLALWQKGQFLNLIKNNGSLIPSSPLLASKKEKTSIDDSEPL